MATDGTHEKRAAKKLNTWSGIQFEAQKWKPAAAVDDLVFTDWYTDWSFSRRILKRIKTSNITEEIVCISLALLAASGSNFRKEFPVSKLREIKFWNSRKFHIDNLFRESIPNSQNKSGNINLMKKLLTGLKSFFSGKTIYLNFFPLNLNVVKVFHFHTV